VVSVTISRNGGGQTHGNAFAIALSFFLEAITDFIDRPKNAQELFNLRHAQARNIIERIFGVLKRRFRILLIGPEYSYVVQAQIPAALCAVHNFIRIHDPTEETVVVGDDDQVNQQANAGDVFVHQIEYNEAVDGGVAARRDQIAQRMWQDYLQVLEVRQQEDDGADDDLDDDLDDYADENIA